MDPASESTRLRSVLEIGRAFASTLDHDELLRLILQRTTEVMRADRASLFLLDQAKGELWSKIALGVDSSEIRVRVGEGIAGWVAQNGRPLRVDDVYTDSRFNPAADRESGYRTRSLLSVPLRDVDGQTTGVVQVLNKKDGSFSEDDEEILLALAGHAATALENARMYESLRGRVRELDLLVEIESEVSIAQHLDGLMGGLCRRAAHLVEAESSILAFPGKDTVALFFHHGDRAEKIRVPAPGPNAEVAASYFQIEAEHHIAADFQAQDGAQGFVLLINKLPKGSSFAPEDAKLAALLAGQVSRAIGLARAREERIQESRLAAIGKTLAGVLHDLRSPMTVVSGFAQLMADDDDPAVRQEHSREIARQCDRVGHMIREVLAFARGEKQILVRRVFLGPYLEEIARELGREFSHRNVEIVASDIFRGTVHFDEQKMRRLIHNLARNAVEAMPRGGRFSVHASLEPDHLLLRFSDTGSGIPKELSGRLFEPFASSGKREGTGLGLAIVRKIVEDHGGTIRYESRPNEGTTFEIRLPQRRE